MAVKPSAEHLNQNAEDPFSKEEPRHAPAGVPRAKVVAAAIVLAIVLVAALAATVLSDSIKLGNGLTATAGDGISNENEGRASASGLLLSQSDLHGWATPGESTAIPTEVPSLSALTSVWNKYDQQHGWATLNDLVAVFACDEDAAAYLLCNTSAPEFVGFHRATSGVIGDDTYRSVQHGDQFTAFRTMFRVGSVVGMVSVFFETGNPAYDQAWLDALARVQYDKMCAVASDQ